MLQSINSLVMIYSLIKLTDQVSDKTRAELGVGEGFQVGFLTNANLPQLSFPKCTR